MAKIFTPASDGGAVSTSSLPPSSSGGAVSVLVSLKGEALLPTRLISKIFNILDTPWRIDLLLKKNLKNGDSGQKLQLFKG